jgi:hypothetical protein
VELQPPNRDIYICISTDITDRYREMLVGWWIFRCFLELLVSLGMMNWPDCPQDYQVLQRLDSYLVGLLWANIDRKLWDFPIHSNWMVLCKSSAWQLVFIQF